MPIQDRRQYSMGIGRRRIRGRRAMGAQLGPGAPVEFDLAAQDDELLVTQTDDQITTQEAP